MANITIDKAELSTLVRENLIEILKNRNDLFELIEDIAFGKLIEKGDTGEYIDEKEVFSKLDNI